ncbi:hypothetical protein Mycsm_00258 [Mycobacterium sp. JS623]|uniref:hypothetical protein n=1 Tax=Mycobacterium sp. JS623 TaxID=212767 RepID=UPI0002A55BF7|nr:hypothetical protein [Mycobacterium sp. JS623]AGB20714.1 hypothetical protein Mycsm_00258 [Mycobacterium sp. JS623]
MPSSRMRKARMIAAAAACSVVFASPSAIAAPGTDPQGYVDSTARCASPSVVVLFGSTDSSRVAICKAPDGQYEYRGVRVRDGAELILSASQTGEGFVANSNGVSYTVTATSLIISQGGNVIREETMVDSHGQQASSAPAPPAPTTTTPTTQLPPPLPAEVGGR